MGTHRIEAEVAVRARWQDALGMAHERLPKLPNPYAQGFDVKRQTFVGSEGSYPRVSGP